MVIDNGFLSRSIFVKRGARQGCPLSPLLYCLVAKTLGNTICQNCSITGLQIPCCVKHMEMSQYADGTMLFLGNSFSIDQALSSVHDYEHGSGPKVNYDMDKSCGKWLLNSYLLPVVANKQLYWTSGPMEMLGLLFGDRFSEVCSWQRRVEKLSKRLDTWNYHSLSSKGRVLVVNSIALSVLVYVGTVYRLPECVCKQIYSVIR